MKTKFIYISIVSLLLTSFCWSQVPPSEKAALVALYNATNGDEWTNKTNWDFNTPVTSWNANAQTGWYGVRVSNGHINRLFLQKNNLSGTIPLELGNLLKLRQLYLDRNDLSGLIPETLKELNLTYISLHSNKLTGPVPSWIGNFHELRYLHLGANKLTGTIPSELGGLSKLNNLNLGYNNLIGSIPTTLENLLELQILSLKYNKLSGAIPEWLQKLKALQHLILVGNQFTGPIPEVLGSLSNLSILDLNRNKLSGTIPNELGNLSKLRYLLLADNQLSGTTPSILGTLSSLTRIDLYQNNFSGNIPFNLNNIPNLGYLLFKDNKYRFIDFEANHVAYKSINYNYAPQSKIDTEETKTVQVGSNITFTMFTTGPYSTNNTYQWYKGTYPNGTVISGEINRTHTINNSTISDAGSYYCLAKNTVISGLTLERNPIHFYVEEAVCNPIEGYIHCKVDEFCTDKKHQFFIEGLINYNQGDITSYNWEVYEGNSTTPLYSSQTIPNPIYSFLSPGEYTIKLDITYGDNCTESLERTIRVDNCISADNSFCASELEYYPTVGNLIPNGANIEWYTTATGGTPLSSSEELVEEAEDPIGAIYWWDDINDNSSIRVQVIAYVNSGVLDSGGPGDNDYDYQEFPVGQNATVADLIPTGANIQWYDTAFSNTPLSGSVPLVNDGIYYVEEVGVTTCRLKVDVFIGTKPPTGDGIQYLCPGKTIADIAIELQDVASTAVWYNSITGGTELPITTVLSDNTTYYVAQIDENDNESAERLAVIVFLNTVNQPIVPSPIQIFDIDQTPPPTIADLIAYGYDIQWYPQETGGNVYGASEPLFEPGVTSVIFWAEQNVGPCPSTRVPVEAQLVDIPEPPLLNCEKFKPQPGDRYVINAWVREQGVIATNPQVRPFNDSLEEDRFLELLKHLLEVTQHIDKDKHDINDEVYTPINPVDGGELDFDILIPFVKNIGQEIKLKVYSYERINDEYGRAVGFKFKLSAHDDAPLFEWKTPSIVSYPGTPFQQTVRYPINDNPDLDIQFTNAEIQGNNINITSNFSATGTPSLVVSNYVYTSISGIEESVTDHDYIDEPNFQLISYMETLIDITYEDENHIVFLPGSGQTPIFRPKGDVIDGWQRIYGEFKIPGNAAQMRINLKNEAIDGKFAYFDDIRIHPYDSNMKTFVYHPVTQRLMSELDENNYATFYEYDAEGGLIRVKKETERGVYTIQETRSSTTKQTN